MAILQLPRSHLYVKYLYDNNGSPYFQIRIPADLKHRFNNRAKISIPLHVEDGAPVIQVQRLANNHKLLFRALRADPSLTLTDEKAAALTFLRGYILAGTFNAPRNMEIHVGSEDWQSDPIEVARLGEAVGARCYVTPGRGHTSGVDYVCRILDTLDSSFN